MEEQLELPGVSARPDLLALYSPVMGSGKSVIAQVLVEEFGFTLVKFAGCLKDMTRSMLTCMGIPPIYVERMVEGDLKEEPIPDLGNLTTRIVMQTLGTDWGRELIHPDLWVKIAMARVDSLRSRGKPVVIDDLRFPNEFDAVKAAGGQCLMVYRPSAKATNDHSSEGALASKHNQFDTIITNNGTLEDLRAHVRKTMA